MMATILVVDDEPDLEKLILQKFRRPVREGTVSFIFARDGTEALHALERNPEVGLVLLDINMPRIDGLTLLQKLQETEADKRSTIIVSAYGDMNNIRVAMNRGAFDFLTKPIDLTDLEKTVDKTLRHVEKMREYRRRQIQAERAHASLCRYFSPQLATRLAADEGTGMDVHRREVAAMFTDVTGFTSMVEGIATELLRTLLNDYVAGMTEIVFAHEGTVAKVMGDGMHILFNAPGDQPDYATRAIACAHDLDGWAVEFRERWGANGVNFGVTRIGVHAGPVLVGNFGGSRFFDYAAYGDTINTAARLEAANKFLGTRTCVSAAVADAAQDFQGRPIGDLVLRGRSEPLRAYEPLPTAVFRRRATADYAAAFAKLEAGDADAMPAFAAVVGLHADDLLAGFHLRRLLNGGKGVRMQLE